MPAKRQAVQLRRTSVRWQVIGCDHGVGSCDARVIETCNRRNQDPVLVLTQLQAIHGSVEDEMPGFA